MQFASFDLEDPVVSAFELELSVQVVTLENLYGLAADHVETHEQADTFEMRADRLAWAGQQEQAQGHVELCIDRTPSGSLRAVVHASAPEPIRCVKLLIRNLDGPLEVVLADGVRRAVGEYGELLSYPGTLPTPLLFVDAGGHLLGLRAEDEQVREKRFAVSVERTGPLAGRGVVELIHEQAASLFSSELVTPPWVLTPDAEPAEVEHEHLRFVERAHDLAPWQERSDVPDWARRLRLVAVLHGMHFTGRVFLRYSEMLDVLRFLSERLPGEQVLAYLPGWEGRYYWQYGDYRPEPRLGGEKAFGALCEGARELGVHLMPMFGANCANVWLPAMAGIDPSAHMKSATGNRFHGNQPDWDLARAHDTGWQAWLNPGHPEWRERLATAIETLASRHGIDAVFLDTAHAWTNDPDHPVTEGLGALVRRLRSNIPQLLLAAEADYDALMPLFPLFQRPWWTSSPGWSARYVRRFGHLCEGEPRGRTGVHEFGVYASDAWSGGPGYLPTVAFQDGTLAQTRGELERRLADLVATESGSSS